MLLELAQSELAGRLEVANRAIVALLGDLADADEGADAVALAARWSCGSPPKTELVEAVLALEPGKRRRLHAAVAADVGFDASLEDSSFRFAFGTLDEETRDAGRELLLAFYRQFLGTGLDLGGTERENRTAWERAFREANRQVRVCPACLSAQLEEPIHNRSAVDADHYLPKSLYPPLALHGLNLVPICKVCNGPAKATTDPLADADLVGIWFPYRRPGLAELRLFFGLDEGLPASVRLAGDGPSGGRARCFDELFGLSQRWSSSLEDIHHRLRAQLQADRVSAEAGLVQERLAIYASVEESVVTVTPLAHLASSYYRWLLEDPDALKELVEELEATIAAGGELT